MSDYNACEAIIMNNERRRSAKFFGTGRIIFWRGGSLWIGCATEQTNFHAHHAIQTTVVLSGSTVRLRCPEDDWIPYAAAIVAAHQPHAFQANDELVALIFTEPESREGQGLRERYRKGIAPLDANVFADEMAQLTAAYAEGAADEVLATGAKEIIEKLTSIQALPVRPLDGRIERAIEVLRARIGEAITMPEVANTVHLSPERFRHLFLQETGIRFRPYVLWLRLEVAVASYAAGNNLTKASHDGGFADSAHFSRTFKRMFGVPAIGVQRD